MRYQKLIAQSDESVEIDEKNSKQRLQIMMFDTHVGLHIR